MSDEPIPKVEAKLYLYDMLSELVKIAKSCGEIETAAALEALVAKADQEMTRDIPRSNGSTS